MNSVFNSVPPIIKNDATPSFASFLFAEEKNLFSKNKDLSDDTHQPMPASKEQVHDVNQESAQNAARPTDPDPHSLVNDDLAACWEIAFPFKKLIFSFLINLESTFRSISFINKKHYLVIPLR
jgi:hypothetical protein